MKIIVITIIALIPYESTSTRVSEKNKDMENLKSLSLWKYVQGENDYFRQISRMYNHTKKYTFLITFYGREALKSDVNIAFVVNCLQESYYKLNNALISFSNFSVVKDFVPKLKSFIGDNEKEKLLEALNSLLDHSIIIIASADQLKLLGFPDLKSRDFECKNKVALDIIKQFPPPHKGDEKYDFYIIPSESEAVKEKLAKITQLIQIEYESFDKEMKLINTREDEIIVQQ